MGVGALVLMGMPWYGGRTPEEVLMLPREIREKLPEGIDPDEVKAVVALKAGLGGSWGETFVLLHGERLLALSRDSVLEPFRVLELDPASLPRLEVGSWQEVFTLTTTDGVEHDLQFSELDKEEALAGLADIYRQLEAWPALAAVLEVKLSLATVTERRVELMLRLGALHQEQMAQPDAAASYFVQILERTPLDAEATRRLEALVLEEVALDERAAALLQAYRAQRRLDDWVRLRAAQVELCEDDAQRLAWLLELATVLEAELGAPERAMTFLLQAWSLRPAAREVFARLLTLAELTTAWEELLATAEGLLAEEGALVGEVREAVLWEVGEACARHLEDAGRAIAAFARLRDLAPGRLDVLRRLEELHLLQEDFEALVEVLQARVERTAAPDARVALLVQLAAVQEDHLARLDSASEALERALELDTTHAAALARLERLYTAQERWVERMAIGERRLALLDDAPEERVELCMQLADLAETALDDRERAIAWLLRALDHGDRLEPLERLVDLLERVGRHDALADALERLVSLTADPERRIALLTSLAQAHEARAEPRAVEGALRRILEVEPGHRPSLEWLRRVLEGGQERGADLAEILEQLARLLKAGSPERMEALVERARLLERLQRREDAILTWDRVIAEDSGHLEAYDALVRLHRVGGDLSQMASVLERSVPLLASDDAQVKRLMELGILYEEELRDAELAARHYAAALERDPRRAAAFQRLEALNKAERDWAGLIELYLKRAGSEEGDALEFTLAAARVAETRRSEPERAYQLLMKLFEGHWHASTLNGELARLAAVTGRWRELLSAYVALHETHHDPAERREIEAMIDDALKVFKRALSDWGSAATSAELAELFERRLDNPGRALTYHREVLKANPGDPEAMEGGRRLLRRKERWSDLAQHLEAMIALAPRDRAALRSLYGELVELYTAQVPSPSQAEQAQQALDRLNGGGGAIWMVVAAAVVLAVVVGLVAMWR